MTNLILLLRPKRPSLSNAQLERLASISSDIAQVCLASIVIKFLIDDFQPHLVLLGSGISLILWITSVWVSGKQRYE